METRHSPAQDDSLAYTLAGQTRYYHNVWEKIEDNHYAECPVSIAARGQRKSTLCMCAELEAAEECLRCHQFPEFCKCGKKAQIVGGC